jgi:Lipase (class 3)
MPGTPLSMPLVTPPKYDLALARTCSFFVNVGSNMGDQFVSWRAAHPHVPASLFLKAWIPKDDCPITSGDHSLLGYSITNLFFGTIADKVTIEPFAFSAVSKLNPTVTFLVFRGTKTGADVLVDADHSQTDYRLSSGEGQGKVDKGFFDLFKTMEQPLTTLLKTLFASTNRNLVITGHSLGSALATLTVPLAAKLAGGSGGKVQHYNQASPRVGDPTFAAYFNAIDAPTFRLVNIEDVVPTLPDPESKTKGTVYYYQHVGSQASFSAQYLSVPNNHNPCCSYSYALYHPEEPFNPTPGNCFPAVEASAPPE